MHKIMPSIFMLICQGIIYNEMPMCLEESSYLEFCQQFLMASCLMESISSSFLHASQYPVVSGPDMACSNVRVSATLAF